MCMMWLRQTLYTLKVLRAYGVNDSAISSVYQAVIISKLIYGSSAWWGFPSLSDRQWIQAFIRRSERSRFTRPYLAPFANLCCEADVSHHPQQHVLHHPLPPTTLLVVIHETQSATFCNSNLTHWQKLPTLHASNGLILTLNIAYNITSPHG